MKYFLGALHNKCLNVAGSNDYPTEAAQSLQHLHALLPVDPGVAETQLGITARAAVPLSLHDWPRSVHFHAHILLNITR